MVLAFFERCCQRASNGTVYGFLNEGREFGGRRDDDDVGGGMGEGIGHAMKVAANPDRASDRAQFGNARLSQSPFVVTSGRLLADWTHQSQSHRDRGTG